jgi:hypothetical protein
VCFMFFFTKGGGEGGCSCPLSDRARQEEQDDEEITWGSYAISKDKTNQPGAPVIFT